MLRFCGVVGLPFGLFGHHQGLFGMQFKLSLFFSCVSSSISVNFTEKGRKGETLSSLWLSVPTCGDEGYGDI